MPCTTLAIGAHQSAGPPTCRRVAWRYVRLTHTEFGLQEAAQVPSWITWSRRSPRSGIRTTPVSQQPQLTGEAGRSPPEARDQEPLPLP